jgi:hypothetical protein
MLRRIRRVLASAAFVSVLAGTGRDATAQQRPIDCLNVTQIPISECQALFNIYFSLNGPTWRSNVGWLVLGNPCEWLGVDCNSQPWPLNVTSLVIHNNDVSGVIPEDIAHLPQLRTLILSNATNSGYFNRIGGTLPTALAQLDYLEEVDLRSNQIAGTIPSEYGNLPALKILRLGDNLLEGPIPSQLYRLRTLEILDLSRNRLGGSLQPEIAGLEHLLHLDVTFNDFSGPIPDALGTLPHIESIQLQHNRLTGPLPNTLTGLGSLRFFKAHDNALAGALSPSIALWAAGLNVCELQNNADGLCLPETALYDATPGGVCGLTPRMPCSPCDIPMDVSADECRVLETLFYRTNGPSWLDRAGWLDSRAACAWTGVSCEAGAVSAIALPQNGLAGEIPSELAALPGLGLLDLSNNRLLGAVPFPLAERAAGGLSCSLTGNTDGLCVPDTDRYRALGVAPVCGLPLVTACAPAAPVALVGFAGRAEGRHVVLTWEATGGLPGLRYVVERRDGGRFVALGSIDAETNPDSAPRYEFRSGPLDGDVATIRLRQINPDGTETTSNPIDLLLASPRPFFVQSPFPNPLVGRGELGVGVFEEEHVRVFVYDAIGRRVAALLDERIAAGTVRWVPIDAEGWAAGWYVVRVEGESFAASEAFVVR